MKRENLKFVLIFFIAVISLSSKGQETLGTKISKIKVYNYDKTELLSTAKISGSWSTRGDKIRIDYGFLNHNRSIVELQVLDTNEIGGELKMECKDTGSGEKIIAYFKEDPINSGKPILEIRIKSSQQSLQFLYN